MGWLGWTEQQALDADVNAIMVGMRGKTAMLREIFGGTDEPVPVEKLPVLTPARLKAAFGRG